MCKQHGLKTKSRGCYSCCNSRWKFGRWEESRKPSKLWGQWPDLHKANDIDIRRWCLPPRQRCSTKVRSSERFIQSHICGKMKKERCPPNQSQGEKSNGGRTKHAITHITAAGGKRPRGISSAFIQGDQLRFSGKRRARLLSLYLIGIEPAFL